MARYKVDLERHVYQSGWINIEAETEPEARGKALIAAREWEESDWDDDHVSMGPKVTRVAEVPPLPKPKTKHPVAVDADGSVIPGARVAWREATDD